MMKEWYEGCISDGAVRVINRVHYCGSACTTCQVQAAFDMRGTCVTPDTWHMQPIFHTLESSRFWVLLLLEPQSGALRIGAYRDFHPTQISTYSFWPCLYVLYIIHFCNVQSAPSCCEASNCELASPSLLQEEWVWSGPSYDDGPSHKSCLCPSYFSQDPSHTQTRPTRGLASKLQPTRGRVNHT